MVQISSVWKQLGVPLLVMGAGCLVFFALFTDVHFDADRPHNPVTWPSMMTMALMAVAGVMLLWNLRNLWKERRNSPGQQATAGTAPPASDEIIGEDVVAIVASEGVEAGEHDNRKMVLGFLGIVGYGVATTYLGFAFATFLVILYWLVISGQRRVLPILLTGVVATLVFLFVFLKMAYMPLPKGVGVFHDLTIGLYRTLGLF
ncbi:MAG: tripartite tricarboxylate transporter TctB family protein [Gemmatimonadetes bacterium]|nr:tripartite tricarboxylate transporter TctB family protein [Gemmatimonadota bacterium]